MKRTIFNALFIAAIIIPLGTAGCGTEWEGLAMQFLEEWANEHNINPTSLSGAANLAGRAASGSTGNEEADAAIGYEEVVENVRENGEEEDIRSGEETDLVTKGNGSTGADSSPAQGRLSEDPNSHVEGFAADESGGTSPQPAGLSHEEVVDRLSERVKPVSTLTTESTEEVFEKVKDLVYDQDAATGEYEPSRTSGHDVVEVSTQDGEKIKIGILVSPDGRIMYTPDGKDYYPDLESAVDPSITQRASELYGDTKDWMWRGLFEGSTRDKDIDLQNRVASEVLDDLRNQLADEEEPRSVGDWVEGQLWDKQVKEPIQESVHQMLWEKGEEVMKEKVAEGLADADTMQLFQEMKFQFDGGKTTTPKAWENIKEKSGLDLFDLVEVDGFKAGELAVSGAEFALESIKTMGRGLQDTDFALRSRAYIAERNSGQKPEVIWQRMRAGELPELDIGSGKNVSGGVSSMMASSDIEREAQLGVMFTMYEQTYQRYQIAESVGR